MLIPDAYRPPAELLQDRVILVTGAGDGLGEAVAERCATVIKIRLVDKASQTELARFDLSEAGSHTGLIMARLFRQAGDWHFQALGDKTQGRTFQDMLPLIQSRLAR